MVGREKCQIRVSEMRRLGTGRSRGEVQRGRREGQGCREMEIWGQLRFWGTLGLHPTGTEKL